MAKAKWQDYLRAAFDPNVAVYEGELVRANGLSDPGKSTAPKLSNEEYDIYDAYNSTMTLPEAYDGYLIRQRAYNAAMRDAAHRTDSGYAAIDDPFWKSLSPAEQQAFIDAYGDAASPELIASHLADLAAIGDFNLERPTFNWNSEEEYKKIDDYLAVQYAPAYQRLDDEIANQTQSFNDLLKTNADYYNRNASNLLSNQYLANAQTYDALRSDMRKARQTALEAGASAGIRLAGNVNALLSAQNKQSQTAMDTSNALAEMMLQQRNAAAGIRSDYGNYMSSANDRRTALESNQRSEREGMYGSRHSEAQSNYQYNLDNYNAAKTDWEDKFSSVDPSNKMGSQYHKYLRNN